MSRVRRRCGSLLGFHLARSGPLFSYCLFFLPLFCAGLPARLPVFPVVPGRRIITHPLSAAGLAGTRKEPVALPCRQYVMLRTIRVMDRHPWRPLLAVLGGLCSCVCGLFVLCLFRSACLSRLRTPRTCAPARLSAAVSVVLDVLSPCIRCLALPLALACLAPLLSFAGVGFGWLSAWRVC